ncbi:MAG: metallophosphoesterase [Candidatus Omnitrophota bacterium]
MVFKLRLFFIIICCLFSLGIFAQPLSPIVIYGDSRTNHDKHLEIARAIGKVKPAVVFHTGDLVEYGDRPVEWKIFNAISFRFRKGSQFFPCLGNHDIGDNAKLFRENFNLPNNERWYAVERQGVYFIIIDTNSDLASGSGQLKWLEAKLKELSIKDRLKIVIMHSPPFSSGISSYLKNEPVNNLVTLFERYNVSAVFCGHRHFYERLIKNGITYIVTGGGGAPLHDIKERHPFSKQFKLAYHFCKLTVSSSSIYVEVLNQNLGIIDKFHIPARQAE